MAEKQMAKTVVPTRVDREKGEDRLSGQNCRLVSRKIIILVVANISVVSMRMQVL